MRYLLCFLLAFSLLGCGGSDNTKTEPAASPSKSSEPSLSSSAMSSASSSAINPALTKSLINKAATPEAKNLHGFLADHFSHRIISGQYGDEDIKWIKELTGKTPAIHGFDFMDYTPVRKANGAMPADTENAIDWVVNKKGIVQFSWHWDAPADAYDEAYREECKNVTGGDARWWKAFYSCASNFDLTDALNNPDGEKYKAILRDIDLIAIELGKLQAAGVPVLWRPLHEAAGKWFWWGKQGPEPTKRLWKLLHERLVQTHGLNNLIWIWNDYGSEHGNAMEWYPGNEYVDIIAYDYPRATSWSEYQTNHGTSNTIFGLAEVSNFPNLANFNNAYWSFFIGWNGLIQNSNAKSFIKWTYNSNKVFTLENLPDLKNYVRRIPDTAAPDPTYASDPDLDFGPRDNPAGNLAFGKMVEVSSTEAEFGNVATHLTDGRSVTRWSSVYSDPQWVIVDLENSVTVDRIEILWQNARASDYTLDLSDDKTNWTTVKSVTGGKGSVDDWGNLASKARYVRLSASKRATVYGVSIFEIRAYSTTPIVLPNMALGKTVTVSSTETEFGNIASNAVDGDNSTRWSSTYSDPQWITVDLDEVKTISGVKILWESAYAKSYKIQASLDNTTWRDLFTTTTGDGGTDTLESITESARYVRIYCDLRATKWGNSIYEITIY